MRKVLTSALGFAAGVLLVLHGRPDLRSYRSGSFGSSGELGSEAERPLYQPSQAEYLRLQREVESIPSENSGGTLNTWTCIGPFGMTIHQSDFHSGRILGIEVENGAGIRFASAMGGLWELKVIGIVTVPVPLSDNLNCMSIGAFATSPTSPNTIFVGTGEPFGGGALGQTVGTGMWKTTNGGASWASVSSIYNVAAFYGIYYHPNDPLIMHAATTNGYYRSTNGGGDWNYRRDGDMCGLVINPVHPDSMFLAAVGFTISRSTNGGFTWNTYAQPGFPNANVGRIALALCKASPNVMYAYVVTRDSQKTLGIFKTTNSGASWADVSFRDLSTDRVIDTHWGQGYYNNVMTVDPTNPDIAMAGGGSMLRTTNGGISWSQSDTTWGWIHTDQHAFTWLSDGSILYNGSDGGLFYSTDHGAHWNSSLNHLPITQFYTVAASPNKREFILGGAQDNSVPFTSDGGGSWRWTEAGDGQGVSIGPLDPRNIYKGWNSNLQRSNDSGKTWSFAMAGLDAPRSFILLRTDMLNRNRVYCATNMYVYQSLDTGQSWSRLNGSPWPASARNITISNASVGPPSYLYDALFGLGSAANKLKVYDFSTSLWSERSSGLPPTSNVYKVAVHPRNATTAYAILEPGTGGHVVFKTTDAGLNWTDDITGNLPAGLPVVDIIPHPTNDNILYLATQRFGCFRTMNGGRTWSRWNTGWPSAVSIAEMTYIDSTGYGGGFYIVAATNGRSVWMRDITGIDTIFGISTYGRIFFDLRALPGRVWVTADSGLIGQFTPSTTGGSWGFAQVPTLSELYSAAMIDSIVHIVAGQGGAIFRSTDTGKSWAGSQSPSSDDLYCTTFLDQMTGFAGGANGTILKTTDGGASWEKEATNSLGTFLAISFTDTKNGWAAGMKPPVSSAAGRDHSLKQTNAAASLKLLLRTTDGGQAWSESPQLSGPGAINHLEFLDASIGYATDDSGGIFKSTDGGLSWGSLKSGTSEPLYDACFLDAEHGWVCGGHGTILQTEDGGATWTPEQSGEANALTSITWSDNQLFAIAGGHILSRPTPDVTNASQVVNKGWNLISTPVLRSDNAKTTLFPGAVSRAYGYDGKYTVAESLKIGNGYWLKYTDSQPINIVGGPVSNVVVPVKQGWNLIGSASAPIFTADITSEPPGIIASPFFGYSGVYTIDSTVLPGKSCWVKVKNDGQLQLPSPSIGFPPKRPAATHLLASLNTLTIHDDQRRAQTLYYSIEELAVSQGIDMPPPPPPGGFDVRFADGSMIISAGDEQKDIAVVVTSGQSPLTVSWETRQQSEPAALFVGGTETKLIGRGHLEIRDAASTIRLRLPRSSGKPQMPTEYTLAQNYPNPFNPTTVIRYQLAVNSLVKLSVYDLLGRKVATLIDGMEDAGDKAHEWHAGSFATGVYVYRLEAEAVDHSRRFISSRKLLLLK